jgi:hypothetical protein
VMQWCMPTPCAGTIRELRVWVPAAPSLRVRVRLTSSVGVRDGGSGGDGDATTTTTFTGVFRVAHSDLASQQFIGVADTAETTGNELSGVLLSGGLVHGFTLHRTVRPPSEVSVVDDDYAPDWLPLPANPSAWWKRQADRRYTLSSTAAATAPASFTFTLGMKASSHHDGGARPLVVLTSGQMMRRPVSSALAALPRSYRLSREWWTWATEPSGPVSTAWRDVLPVRDLQHLILEYAEPMLAPALQDQTLYGCALVSGLTSWAHLRMPPPRTVSLDLGRHEGIHFKLPAAGEWTCTKLSRNVWRHVAGMDGCVWLDS